MQAGSYFNVVEAIAASAGGDGERVGGLSAPAPAAASSYLESSGKHCDVGSEVDEITYEVQSCGCRSFFCKHCCVGKGLALRSRLIPILQTFTGLMMWTFTVDPTLFTSPAEAFAFVRDNRCISNVMRRLRERGFLHSGRYIVFVEWQEKTQMAHWHVLADCSFIPFDLVCNLWNRFRPASAGPVQGDRPGFGSVRFSAPKFANAHHAACYGCKYLIQYPQGGYPDWVMDTPDIHRYTTSRSFWGTSEPREAVEAEQEADEPQMLSEEDQCPCCGHEEAGACDHCPSCGWSVLDEDQLPEEKRRRTIREILAKCGEKSVIMRRRQCVDEATGELVERREFVGRLTVPLAEVVEAMGKPLEPGRRRLAVDPDGMRRLMKQFGERSRNAIGGSVDSWYPDAQ